MACLEMYNNTPPPQTPPTPPPMSPRISFSNDFVESHNSQHLLINSSRSEVVAPASTDFEFSVSNYNKLTSATTATADELFFKGRLLPFKDNGNGNGNGNGNPQMQRTLRDELLVDDDPHPHPHPHLGFSLKPPKSSSSNRWKGFLGLRKSHIGSKKPEKIDAPFDSGTRFSFALEDPNLTKTPQDMVSSEGPSSSDMEMRI